MSELVKNSLFYPQNLLHVGRYAHENLYCVKTFYYFLVHVFV